MDGLKFTQAERARLIKVSLRRGKLIRAPLWKKAQWPSLKVSVLNVIDYYRQTVYKYALLLKISAKIICVAT